jgi:hypothetical protein
MTQGQNIFCIAKFIDDDLAYVGNYYNKKLSGE